MSAERPEGRAQATRACVLHPEIIGSARRHAPERALEEAVALAEALRLDVAFAEVVRLRKPHPGLLFGEGKLAELEARLKAEAVELVIIDGPVSPVQQRELEKRWKVKILDRTGLILEIFADRAATREGVLQVELAALNYAKTRLVRSWTHLERQRGGLGFVGGPGETQIEADRRAIDDQIVRIRRQLAKVTKTRALHRAARARVPYPVVALVGYTNAGKSTLFNRLTGAEVMARDMLFATLDPTMREVTVPEAGKVILSDTVGFISELPTMLVAAFRATLEEVLDADLILHVRDISHPDTEAQARDVREILADLGIDEERQAQSVIEVWNKIDRLPPEERAAAEARAARQGRVVPVSALTGEGLEGLRAAIGRALREPVERAEVELGFSEGARRAWLYERGLVRGEEQTDEGLRLTVEWTPAQAARFAKLPR